jgi:DNA polymerase-3 subunit delta
LIYPPELPILLPDQVGCKVSLTEDIAAGRCGPFYLVVSPEEYLRVDAFRRWLAALEARAPHEVHTFRAPRWDIAELENILLTVPLFGDAVAVVIHDIEKTHAAHQERLVSMLSVRGAHVSVLATAGTIDKRRKFYKALAKLGPVENFNRIYDEQRPGWVHRIAGDFGWSISGEAAAAIAELVGEDLMAYEAELRKIILYIGDKRRIEKADVDDVLFADNRFGGFAIAEAISKRDLSRALRVIKQLYSAPGSKSGWMPLLAGAISRLLRVQALAKTNSDREIGIELGLNPYVVKLLRSQAARFSRDDLLRGIELLYEVEQDIKMSVLPGLPAAEIFLIKLLYGESDRRAAR